MYSQKYWYRHLIFFVKVVNLVTLVENVIRLSVSR